MNLFHEIPDAEAIVCIRGGLYKQVKLYHRNGRVFIGVSGGFIRVTAQFGDSWGTSHPSTRVVDHTQGVPGLFFTGGEPRYTNG